MESIHNNRELFALKELGLHEKEALIYLAAISTGGATIADLAEAANIERTGIYYHIENLLEQKLLKTITQGKRTIYLPSDPDRLKKMSEERQKAFNNIFPGLEQRFSRQSGKSIFQYFEGKEEVSKFYDYVYRLLFNLKSPDNLIYVLGNSYKTATESNKEFLNFTPPAQKIDIITKAILPESQKSKKIEENVKDPYIVTRYNLPPAQLKYMSDKYKYPGSVVITGNKIIQYDFRNLIFSITENKNLAQTWRMFFELIWDHLK